MASVNKTATVDRPLTHQGGAGELHVTPLENLRRSVMNCLLWEDTFYESGVSIEDRINQLAAQVPYKDLALLAIETRNVGKLRHVPLVLICALLKRQDWKQVPGALSPRTVIKEVIQRPDEIAELVALYWRKGKCPLSSQLRAGLGDAFRKFNEYSLAKYDQDHKTVKLRDVMRMVHPKPQDKDQEALWGRLLRGELKTPDTWEVALSSGADKRETWIRLISEGKLGYLALLRNLRNMQQAGVPDDLVKQAILARANGADKVLPWRFVAAVRAAPAYAEALDQALLATMQELPQLTGSTVVLVDVSGSMEHALSGKSDLRRMDAAAALSGIVQSTGGVRVFSFSDRLVEVPYRRGLAMTESVPNSQLNNGTNLAGAVRDVQNQVPKHDRLIVITDEQVDSEEIPDPIAEHVYVINVASYQNGIDIGGKSVRISGFSENVIRWIHAYEQSK